MDVRDLAAQFGTPVFACDEEDFRSRCREFRDAFGDDAGVFYAAKAFCCRAVLRWVSEEGLGRGRVHRRRARGRAAGRGAAGA